MDNLPISVIVIARNEDKFIGKTLESVKINNPAEIIVVDGNSTDKTVEIARRYTQHIFNDGGKGRSCARQIGAQQATQKYIAYVDVGITLVEGALQTMLAEFQQSDCVSMGAKGLIEGNPSGYWEWAQQQHAQISNSEASSEANISMAFSLFRRNTILEYGFELGYGGNMDDVDLSLRLRRDGYIHGISSAVFYYRVVPDFQGFVRYRFFLGQVRFCYIRKYGPWHAKFWPPITTLYWITYCLIKGRAKLITYHLVDGMVETAGMINGFLSMLGERLNNHELRTD